MRIATLGYGADGGSLRHLASEPKARFYSITLTLALTLAPALTLTLALTLTPTLTRCRWRT